jgi:hypothetical protein
MELCINQKRVKQINIYFIFEILQVATFFLLQVATALHTLGILSTSFMR